MKVMAVDRICEEIVEFYGVETPYKRISFNDWNCNYGEGWEPVQDDLLVAKLESAYKEFMSTTSYRMCKYH